ncbi:WhiB family transcriptional regulator [Rhodococcus sp. NPDC056960]|uniref:WhiB family transcriptional regulator n=1 Tax=Rhodococcus TaxID=1827 RepID=UPI00362798CA
MPALMLKLPSPVAESWDWQLAAACRDADPAVFFYLDNERGEPRADRVRAAKKVCLRCPVRAQCLNYAFEARETHGIWGGYTGDERRKLRRLRESESSSTSTPRGDDADSRTSWDSVLPAQ